MWDANLDTHNAGRTLLPAAFDLFFDCPLTLHKDSAHKDSPDPAAP